MEGEQEQTQRQEGSQGLVGGVSWTGIDDERLAGRTGWWRTKLRFFFTRSTTFWGRKLDGLAGLAGGRPTIGPRSRMDLASQVFAALAQVFPPDHLVFSRSPT